MAWHSRILSKSHRQKLFIVRKRWKNKFALCVCDCSSSFCYHEHFLLITTFIALRRKQKKNPQSSESRNLSILASLSPVRFWRNRKEIEEIHDRFRK